MESMENSAVSMDEASMIPEGCYTSIFSGSHAEQEQRRLLYELCERRILTDVTLIVQTEAIAAHRIILASGSPFFHALFTSGMKETRESRIELVDIHVSAFRELLKYMYLGHLEITGETILELLHTANQLEMADVVEICCKQLMLELCVTNCVDIYMCCENLTMRPACRLLAQAASAMIETYFSDVYRTEAFKNLPLVAVLKILLRPKLCMDDGEAVLSWLMHDPKSRQMELATIFQSMRITENPELQTTVSQSVYQALYSTGGMINSKECIETPLTTTHVLAETEDQNQSHQSLTPTIFAIGGFNGPSALRTVEYLDFHLNEWFPAAELHEQRSYSGVVVSEQNRIYVLGGTWSCKHLRTVEEYDPGTNTWTAMAPMRKARSYLGAAYLNGFIYVVGGFNGMSHLNSVERFDLQTQQWEEIQPLTIGRSGLAVVVMNGLIYAIGGYDGRKHLKSVEVYDPQRNEWTGLASMRYARNGPAAVAQEKTNSILVFGGESRHGIRMNTSERLDLNQGTWEDVNAFVDCRSGHVAFSFLDESFLFCLGGSNKKDEYLDTVHRYDHLTRQWSLHSRMLSQRCGLNVAVVHVSSKAACFEAQKQKRLGSHELDVPGM